MKVLTDFGIQEIKPQKIFDWQGIKFAIVKIPESYMNGKEPMTMQRVVEYSTTSRLPVTIQRGETLKSIEQKAINLLSRFENPQELKDKIENFEKIND